MDPGEKESGESQGTGCAQRGNLAGATPPLRLLLRREFVVSRGGRATSDRTASSRRPVERRTVSEGCLARTGTNRRSADLVVVIVLVVVEVVEVVLQCPVVVVGAVPDRRRQFRGFGVRSRVGEGPECGRVVSWPECRAAARVPRCRHRFRVEPRRSWSPSKRGETCSLSHS